MSIWAIFAFFLIPALAEDPQPQVSLVLGLLLQHWIGVGLGLAVLAVLATFAVHVWIRRCESQDKEAEQEIYISPRKLRIPRNCWFTEVKTPQVPTESTPLKSPVGSSSKKMQSLVQRSIAKATFLSQLHADANQSL